MANELRGFLVANHPGNRWAKAPRSAQVLRENIRHKNVRVCEHFVEAVRYSGAKHKIVALILAIASEPVNDTASAYDLSIDEQTAQCTTDPKQMAWMGGQLDTRGKFDLVDDLNHEIVAATRMRDRVAIEAITEAGIVPVSL